MKKISIKKNHLIITVIILMLVVIGSTFAWFTYQSRKSALVLSIGDINDSKVIIKPYQIRKTLAPVNAYTSGVYSQITAINNNDDTLPLTLFYKINELDEILINNGLKYTVVSSNSENGTYTEVVAGNFSNISNNQLVVLETEIAANTTTYYRIYVWLDSSVANQNNVVNSVLNIELNGSIDTVVSFDDHTLMITSYTCNDSSGNAVTVGVNPYFTYTGQCEVVDDGDGDWRIKFLTDGTFTSTLNIPIDVFLVGGGGGGASMKSYSSQAGGGGGGGGYTTTSFAFINKSKSYEIVIGDGGTSDINGEDTTGFGSIAFGGKAGNGMIGGSGGSGGGGGDIIMGTAGDGGSDGDDGVEGVAYYGGGTGGTGQETTTREFGETGGNLYSGGGGGGAGEHSEGGDGEYGTGGTGGGANGGVDSNGKSAASNTGGGGGGAAADMSKGGTGGSGIVVIRNHRGDASTSELPNVGFNFTYIDGYYAIINDGNDNWRIKFLTSGTFTSDTDLLIDAFLVGGGGGGGIVNTSVGGGGGGGGKTITSSVSVLKDTGYSIVIGLGGESGIDGGDTSGFGITVLGGSAGDYTDGGSGGSGGGGGGYLSGTSGGNGGSNGGNGGQSTYSGGTGQGTSTREFGESGGKLYSGGGGGAAGQHSSGINSGFGSGGAGGGGNGGLNGVGASATPNTGGGGGGGAIDAGGTGGSGILIIRNARD